MAGRSCLIRPTVNPVRCLRIFGATNRLFPFLLPNIHKIDSFIQRWCNIRCCQWVDRLLFSGMVVTIGVPLTQSLSCKSYYDWLLLRLILFRLSSAVTSCLTTARVYTHPSFLLRCSNDQSKSVNGQKTAPLCLSFLSLFPLGTTTNHSNSPFPQLSELPCIPVPRIFDALF